MKYKESIKTLESASKSLRVLVRKINNDITHQLEKISEFETKAQEYDKAIKKLS